MGIDGILMGNFMGDAGKFFLILDLWVVHFSASGGEISSVA
jgi:hypothetical protein